METSQDISDLIDDFAFLDDWEDRYTHVIELGKALAPLTEAEHIDANKVKGCVSQVWLIATVHDRPPLALQFRGDSDAHIVKGLVAIVIKIFSNKTPQEILAINAQDILAQLGLAEHLSPQRSNGLHAMITRITDMARSAKNG